MSAPREAEVWAALACYEGTETLVLLGIGDERSHALQVCAEDGGKAPRVRYFVQRWDRTFGHWFSNDSEEVTC